MDTPNTRQIIVTGPQRSGTTIAAVILADDLKLTFVDEVDFVPGQQYSNHVIQSPTALDNYVLFHHMYPKAEFVFVKRAKSDIITSMKRIEWCMDDVNDWEQFVSDYIDTQNTRWKQLKDYLPSQTSEIPYEALKGHRLFVQQDARLNFTAKQWHPSKPIGPRYWSNNLQCSIDMYSERHLTSAKG